MTRLSAMPTAEEVAAFKGRRVSLELDSSAGFGHLVTGVITGTQPAADGLVVTIRSDGEPARSTTLNYQHIRAIRPA